MSESNSGIRNPDALLQPGRPIAGHAEIRTKFCPVCQTGRPVFGATLYSECLKSKLCQNWNGREFQIQTVRISDVWAFGTTSQLSESRAGHLHHKRTFKCYLLSTFPSLFGGWGSGLKRIALNVVLCFTIIPFYFNV